MRNDATRPGVRVRAAETLLDRAWGKPLQAVRTNMNVRDLTDAELISIILEGQAMPELPPPDTSQGFEDEAA
jgi:hypothetical protein